MKIPIHKGVSIIPINFKGFLVATIKTNTKGVSRIKEVKNVEDNKIKTIKAIAPKSLTLESNWCITEFEWT
jgi:hypothetical protein